MSVPRVANLGKWSAGLFFFFSTFLFFQSGDNSLETLIKGQVQGQLAVLPVHLISLWFYTSHWEAGKKGVIPPLAGLGTRTGLDDVLAEGDFHQRLGSYIMG